MSAGRRTFLLAAALGLALCLVRASGRPVPAPGVDLAAAVQGARPESFSGDPAFVRALTAGWYNNIETQFGRVLAAVGLAERLDGVLTLWLTVAWLFQIVFFFLLAERLTGAREPALLGALLFAGGTFLLKIVDAPAYPVASLGRAASLALVLPSLYAYARGLKTLAWAVALGSLYVHGNPGLFLLMAYGLSELYDAARSRSLPRQTLGRFALAAAAVVPLAAGELGQARLPAAYERFAFIEMSAFRVLPEYVVLADWLLVLEGAAWLLFAWPRFRNAPGAPLVRRLLACSAAMLGVSALARWILYPLGLPLGLFLIKITGTLSFLFLFNVLGLVVVAHATWTLLSAEGHAAGLAALVSLLTLRYDGDFISAGAGLTAAAAALWAPKHAKVPLAAAAGACFFWQAFGRLSAPALLSAFGLKGGFLALPFFHWQMAVLFSAAAALAFTRAGKNPKAPAGVLIMLAAALLLYRPAAAIDADWAGMIEWGKNGAPKDAFVLVPCSRPNPYEFMGPTGVAALSPNAGYASSLALQHGHAAEPTMRRMEAFGYDYARSRTTRDRDEEFARICRTLTPEAMAKAAASAGATYMILENAPEGLKALQRSGRYSVHEL